MKQFINILTVALLLLTSCNAQNESNIKNIENLETNVDALVKQYQDLDIFSGIVLVAEHGIPKYHKAFGMANRENKIANTINTKFDIGSMNKSFTKTVILQLIEEGKLKVTDNLGKFIPGFPEIAATKITITDLLDHSSGYTDYWGEGFNDLPIEQKRLAGLVERIKKLRLEFEPGTETAYSNSGYVLLGAIIEKITGLTYHQNVIDRIINPLNMTETYVIDKNKVPNRAIGYFKDMKGNISNNLGFAEVPNPDGGFHSTPSDIVKFYSEYFYGTKLLSKETKSNEAFFGSINKRKTSGKASLMAGGFPGANTAYLEIMRDEISIIVFANMDEPVGEQLASGILALVRGQEPISPSLPANQNVYKHYKKHGIKYIEENFSVLTKNFHSEDPKGMILNGIGYDFLRDDNIEEALKFFQLNVKLFPEDANLWDSLGEVHFKLGNNEKALEYYEKALAIDPYMESATNMIKKIKK
ncbi:beta-lactamase family protein [Flavobacteriaceae bacterium S0862]|nr:beta-lactamase family protein [Flavobacteriaceae bacterium S0862]